MMRFILRVCEENHDVEAGSSGEKEPVVTFPLVWSILRALVHSCSVEVFVFLVEFTVFACTDLFCSARKLFEDKI